MYDTLSNFFQFKAVGLLFSVSLTSCVCANWDIFCSIVCNYKVPCNGVSLLPGGSVTQFCLHVCAILCNLVQCVLAVQSSELAAWWFFAHWSVQLSNKTILCNLVQCVLAVQCTSASLLPGGLHFSLRIPSFTFLPNSSVLPRLSFFCFSVFNLSAFLRHNVLQKWCESRRWRRWKWRYLVIEFIWWTKLSCDAIYLVITIKFIWL